CGSRRRHVRRVSPGPAAAGTRQPASTRRKSPWPASGCLPGRRRAHPRRRPAPRRGGSRSWRSSSRTSGTTARPVRPGRRRSGSGTACRRTAPPAFRSALRRWGAGGGGAGRPTAARPAPRAPAGRRGARRPARSLPPTLHVCGHRRFPREVQGLSPLCLTNVSVLTGSKTNPGEHATLRPWSRFPCAATPCSDVAVPTGELQPVNDRRPTTLRPRRAAPVREDLLPAPDEDAWGIRQPPPHPPEVAWWPRRDRYRRRRRVLKGMALVLVVALGAAGAIFVYGLRYTNQLLDRGRTEVGGLTQAGAGQPFNVLLVGSGSGEGLSEAERKRLAVGEAGGQRTDTIIVLHVSPRNRKA